MGLFSFIKSVGEKLTGGKPVTAENVTEHLKGLGLTIERLGVTISEEEVVTLTGWASDLAEKEKAILAVGNLDGVEKVVDQLRVGSPVVAAAPKPAAAPVAAAPVAAAPVAAPVAPKPEEIEAPSSSFYTVKSGDNLSKIAKEVYGNANKYNDIFEANKPMLKHPDKIFVGQVLRIPQK